MCTLIQGPCMSGRYRFRVSVCGASLGFWCEDQVQIQGIGVRTWFRCSVLVVSRACASWSSLQSDSLPVLVLDTAFVFVSATPVFQGSGTQLMASPVHCPMVQR